MTTDARRQSEIVAMLQEAQAWMARQHATPTSGCSLGPLALYCAQHNIRAAIRNLGVEAEGVALTTAVTGIIPTGAILCPVCLAPNPPTSPEVAGWRLLPYAWVCSDDCEAVYHRVLARIPVAEGFRAARGLIPPWPGDAPPEERIRAARVAWAERLLP